MTLFMTKTKCSGIRGVQINEVWITGVGLYLSTFKFIVIKNKTNNFKKLTIWLLLISNVNVDRAWEDATSTTDSLDISSLSAYTNVIRPSNVLFTGSLYCSFTKSSYNIFSWPVRCFFSSSILTITSIGIFWSPWTSGDCWWWMLIGDFAWYSCSVDVHIVGKFGNF